jgi:hypothetical protein
MNEEFDPHALDDEMAHLDRGGDVAGWVRDEVEPPVRLDDRVHFLPEKDEFGIKNRTTIGTADFAVILWTDNKGDAKPVTLAIDCGPVTMHQTLTPEQAKRIGEALLAAAAEATGGAS